MLRPFYPENQGYAEFVEFHHRMGIGLRGKFVDLDKGLYPVAQLEKIGEGGDNCVVTYASFNANYPLFVRSLVKGLKAAGFNGYIWYRIGGFPNPTGKEIQYAGVPYTFKVGMMLEAHQMGFDRVLWLDSAMIPLQDMTFYFDWIVREGAYFWGRPMPYDNRKYILPVARQSIYDLTGVDILDSTTVMGAIFGWDFSTALGNRLIEMYYRMVENGYAFFSCLPEEFVLGAILTMPEFKPWDPRHRYDDYIPIHCSYPNQDSVEEIEQTRRLQVPFPIPMHEKFHGRVGRISLII